MLIDTGGHEHPDGSYYAATADAVPSHPQLEGSEKADICILGGGFCGLSAALHLAERGYDVALLEANRIGWGASGRNGGQIHSGQRKPIDELEAIVGADDARTMWQLGEDAKALVRSLAEKHGIACDLRSGLIDAAHKPQFVAEYRDYVDLLQSRYGYDKVRFLDTTEIRSKVGSEDYHGGLLDEGAGHLNPLKFAHGIGSTASKAGARIFERSKVVAVTEEASGVRVQTAFGAVAANSVLYCGNGYLAGIEPALEARVLPLNNYIAVTEPLGRGRAASLIRDGECVADSRFVINYFRLTPDDRLLFGGGETYGERFPRDIAGFVRRPMLKIFPQLADVSIDYAWGGTLGITMKRLPVFRRVGRHGFAACGFSGQGVAIAPLAGQILAEAVDGTLSRFDVYARLPQPVFPGGRLFRHPTLTLAMLWYSLRDRL
ncbi:MAG: FAD-binding oxidoreductase [Pseudomonadota bacterium]